MISSQTTNVKGGSNYHRPSTFQRRSTVTSVKNFKVNSRTSVGAISDLAPESVTSNDPNNKLSFLKLKNVKSAIINVLKSFKADEEGLLDII